MAQDYPREMGQEPRLHIPKSPFARGGTLDQPRSLRWARRRSCFHYHVLEAPVRAKRLEIDLDIVCSHSWCPEEVEAW
jgi:hypothetical protein